MLTIGNFFQLGYVTTDLEAAVEVYASRFGVSEFLTIDTASMNPNLPFTSLIGLAWAGDVQIELIQPKDVTTPLYADAMPKTGFGINFHHIGCMIDSEKGWAAAEAEVARQGLTVASRSGVPGKIDVAYVDTRALCGHYLELVWARGDGLAFLQGAPRNPVRRPAA